MGEEKKKSEIAESVSQNRLRPEHSSRSKGLLAAEINHSSAIPPSTLYPAFFTERQSVSLPLLQYSQ
ncbi:hypothetical protein F8C09_22630 [Escherichia coli]|nr:hypothetical protein [Escherichia coli]